MARVISVFLPTWPTDRLRRAAGDAAPPADAPLVIAGREKNRRVVTALDAVAAAAGLRFGMPLTKAQVMVPSLLVENADPHADAESLERLALWVLQRVSPIVTIDPPDGLAIDSAGADHLHGGEDALLDALLGRLTLSGVAARAAIADTWGAAHALARHAGATAVIAVAGHEVARRLMIIPDIGPITATAIAAIAPPAETFTKGRDFAAWLGLVSRQASTGGAESPTPCCTTRTRAASIRTRSSSG